MSEPTLHPNTVLSACDAEADKWAADIDLAQFVKGVARKINGSADWAATLEAFGRQCFIEGMYRGAMNVATGKTFHESMANG